MADYSTNVGEKFAQKVVKKFFESAVAPMITNDQYEGEIKGGGGDRLNVLSYDTAELVNYTGANLSVETPTESEATLIVDQKKAFYFAIKSWDKFKSYGEDPAEDCHDDKAGKLQEAIDGFILGLYTDVGAGNRIGTDYTTGTVTITVTTGAVVGNGTTFASGMVGKPFKAAGHTKWYRVKTFTDATHITIEDDVDDVASAYTGGAIDSGAAYTVQANTSVQVTAATIYGKICDLRTLLNKAKIPKADRWLVVNAEIGGLLDKCAELIHATQSGDEVIKNGFVGTIAGFKVYENEQVAGDSTNGFHILAGHKSGITFAHAFTESKVEEDIAGNFGKAYKGLNCYGAKVIDRRRPALAELYCKL